MKFWAVPNALFPLHALSAAIEPRAVPTGPWEAGAWRPAMDTPLFFLGDAITAADGHFWLNGNTTAYCPSEVSINCTDYSNTTAFLGGNDTVALYAGVPGGQQVYIAPDGTLAYTLPHSASLPDGAITTGFLREMSQEFGAPIVWGMIGRTWNLCPFPIPSNASDVTRDSLFQLYLVPGQLDGCYGTEMRTYTTTANPAWEFTG